MNYVHQVNEPAAGADVLEVTDEMVTSLWRLLPSEVQEGRELDDIRPGVAAVLSIVIRDNTVTERVQTRCGVAGPDKLTCQRSPDHGTNHAASNGDGLVQW